VNLCCHGHDKDVVGVNSVRRCMACVRAMDAVRRYRPERKAQFKKYQLSAKGKARDRGAQRRYYLRYTEKITEKVKQRRKRNPEKYRALRRAYMAKIKREYGSRINYFWAVQMRESQ